ncbi:MAG: GTP-dependent dephospho-CoA kinase family protein [Candidatus Bathyarchaeia archaeon]
MSVAYVLPAKLRRKLKKPLGKLIRGSFNDTMAKLRKMVVEENPPSVVSVGDVVSTNLVKERIYPNLLIVDNRVMRASVEPAKLDADEVKHVRSPPGAITFEALNAVREAFKAAHRVKIIVDGEEDLLALAAILYSPVNSIIVYGQPHEGIVVVKADHSKKAEVIEILKAMQPNAKD